MTDHTDLIALLREGYSEPDGGGDYPPNYKEIQAADALEAQATRIAELEWALRCVVAVYDNGTTGHLVADAFNKARAALAAPQPVEPVAQEYVDCGECPAISTGCKKGRCMKAAAQPVEPVDVVPRSDYDNACKLVADMHLAAMGQRIGPVLGVVEDVADLRARYEALLHAQPVEPVALTDAQKKAVTHELNRARCHERRTVGNIELTERIARAVLDAAIAKGRT